MGPGFESPMVHQLRPVGQAVKTPPSHGGITSSSLVRVTIFLLVGVYGKEVPPVPFPNTEVKLFTPTILDHLDLEKLGNAGTRAHVNVLLDIPL